MATTLTKSLHTVTAVVNVARYLRNNERSASGEKRTYWDTEGKALAREALDVLGYPDQRVTTGADDQTIARIVAACNKLVERA